MRSTLAPGATESRATLAGEPALETARGGGGQPQSQGCSRARSELVRSAGRQNPRSGSGAWLRRKASYFPATTVAGSSGGLVFSNLLPAKGDFAVFVFLAAFFPTSVSD